MQDHDFGHDPASPSKVHPLPGLPSESSLRGRTPEIVDVLVCSGGSAGAVVPEGLMGKSILCGSYETAKSFDAALVMESILAE